ncbi:hypothetical protein ROZALSC1DRAFT_26163, partial [Rozella allomycis CSF55]
KVEGRVERVKQGVKEVKQYDEHYDEEFEQSFLFNDLQRKNVSVSFVKSNKKSFSSLNSHLLPSANRLFNLIMKQSWYLEGVEVEGVEGGERVRGEVEGDNGEVEGGERDTGRINERVNERERVNKVEDQVEDQVEEKGDRNGMDELTVNAHNDGNVGLSLDESQLKNLTEFFKLCIF